MNASTGTEDAMGAERLASVGLPRNRVPLERPLVMPEGVRVERPPRDLSHGVPRGGA
ncbi:hypothetical protein ACVWXU_005627 [Streptomyces sp. TE33382]